MDPEVAKSCTFWNRWAEVSPRLKSSAFTGHCYIKLTPGPLSARPLIRQQVRVQGRSHGRTVGLQGHTGKTRVAAVKGCVVNPSAKIFIMPQGASYLQPKEARIGIHETWCDAPIAAVPVDQNEFPLSHLPGLLHEFRKDAAPHYFRRMKSMKVDLHTEPPA
jgi:hypothetical protein